MTGSKLEQKYQEGFQLESSYYLPDKGCVVYKFSYPGYTYCTDRWHVPSKREVLLRDNLCDFHVCGMVIS